ncbi:UNVERIFIED_CONTAM: Kinetochore protein SPC24 [Sesamum radiatum]|uniref:Kinetochore protein SPC24 n=1 Tax=Sesamum radiatum TaxID=300843 RepID=A0AAW2R3R2_SESRA
MGETSRKMDMEELVTYGNNLIEFLKEDKDAVGLKHFLRQSEALHSQCVKDFNEVQKSIEDYEKKIDSCKQKAAAAESETASDAEIDTLQKELEEGQQVERMFREELR